MNRFSKTSQKRLDNVHPHLQWLCRRILHEIDITVVSGHRGRDEQNALMDKGASRLRFPASRHNHTWHGVPLSLAVDIAPHKPGVGIDWEDIDGFIQLYRVAIGIWQEGLQLGVISPGWTLSWGGHWPRFRDYPHYQLDRVAALKDAADKSCDIGIGLV